MTSIKKNKGSQVCWFISIILAREAGVGGSRLEASPSKNLQDSISINKIWAWWHMSFTPATQEA
jgi:hypothetical protein